jgi:hypothetical protein
MRILCFAAAMLVCSGAHATLITVEYEGVIWDIREDTEDIVGDRVFGSIEFDTDTPHERDGEYYQPELFPEHQGPAIDIWTGYHSSLGYGGHAYFNAYEFFWRRADANYRTSSYAKMGGHGSESGFPIVRRKAILRRSNGPPTT